MSSIPLVALDAAPRPAQNAPPDPLQEFTRASALKTAAGQQQIQQQQIQGNAMSLQQQQQQMQDAAALRALGPQFVQKDGSGKVTGFDTEGYLNAANSVNPQLASGLRAQYSESVLKSAQATKAQRENEQAQNDELHDIGATLLDTLHKNQPATPPIQGGAPAGPAPAQPGAQAAPVPGTGGMPAFMLPNTPQGQQADPGAQQPAPQAAAQAAPPQVQTTPEMMATWHAQLPRIMRLNPQTAGQLNPNQFPTEDQINQFIAGAATHSQQLSDSEKLAKTAHENAQAQSELWKPAGEGTLVNVQTGQLIHGVASPDREAFNSYVKQGGDPINFPAWKAQQEAAATQPYKIQTAEAEGKARQLTEGLGKSVYAFLPDGTHQLMSQTAALQTPGVKAMVPATEKQIGDDIMLNNRLSDVQQKINNYDQALGKLGTTITDKDQSNIAAILGKQAFHVGAFGTEIPVDRLNAALDKENIKGLSDDAIKALAAYYNARESLVGYNRVLSGSARGGEKQMELSQDTLPNLGTTDPRLAREGIRQFRQNLQVVGQGLPVIPGIKRPDEWSPNPGTTPNPSAPAGQFDWNAMPQH